MAAIRQNIGRVGLRLRGTWSDNPQDPYMKMDVVEKDGSSYASKVDNNTTTPPSSSWQVQSQRGAVGQGVPNGGSTGQVLCKDSNEDYDTKWVNPVEQIQSDWNQSDNTQKDFIKNKPTNLVEDESYVHTDNNYTDEDKSKLNSALQSETDPTVPSWAKQSSKPSYTSQEVGALPISTKYGYSVLMSIDSSTYILTLSLKDQDGTVLNTQTVDLPLESVVVNGSYDSTNKKIILTLQNGSTIDVPVGDLVNGLQTEITSSNKLNADLVDDSTSTHKFVTSSDKSAWSGKQDALVSGTNIKSINGQSILGSGDLEAGKQPDWNQTNTSALDYIKNKPDLSIYVAAADLQAMSNNDIDTIWNNVMS